MRVGSLGELVFEVSNEAVLTPGRVSRERAARYEEHKVLRGMPRLEFLSAELQTLRLDIRLSVSLGTAPQAVLDDLDEWCREGIVKRLILGGRNRGMYAITSLSETWGQSYADGRLMSADVSVSLKEYV